MKASAWARVVSSVCSAGRWGAQLGAKWGAKWAASWAAVRVALCAALLGAAGSATAQSTPVCLFFDGAGVAHVADHAVDSRFQCFGNAPMKRRRVPGKTDDLAVLRSSMKLSAPHMALLPAMRQAAARHGLDVELLQALIAVESGFDAAARSPRGALGLMQIMPAYATPYLEAQASEEDVQKALLDPLQHIEVGSRMLADLSRRFGRVDAALAAWNAGPTPVRRHGGVPPISETRAHVHLVLELYWALLQDRQAQRATTFRVHARAAEAGPEPRLSTGTGALSALQPLAHSPPPAAPVPSPRTPPAAFAPASPQRVALAPSVLPR
jgi:hypothetical protein